MTHPAVGRRCFLSASLCGGLAAATSALSLGKHAHAAETAAAPAAPPIAQPIPEARVKAPAARVALTAGGNRADITLAALREFAKETATAIGDRMVVIKPNNVDIATPLSATHADTIEAVLEFLKSIGKDKNVIIAESAGTGPTMEGFSNYGYPAVAKKYGAKMVDIDRSPFEVVHVLDEKDFRPHRIRTSSLLQGRDCYVISVAKMKTHDCVGATLTLKNIIFGSPLKDVGFRFANRTENGPQSDKITTHGNGLRALNFNLFQLSKRLHPHLALIDGYDGMEGNGPVAGTRVDHRVCVASNDWLAADRVGVELMGIDFANIGYLNYCADAGMGQADLRKIEILGPAIARHVKKYKLADNFQEQLIWKKPTKAS
jgi:uncharacterized protein (DUF362 family)